jgi:hypothetical protein
MSLRAKASLFGARAVSHGGRIRGQVGSRPADAADAYGWGSEAVDGVAKARSWRMAVSSPADPRGVHRRLLLRGTAPGGRSGRRSARGAARRRPAARSRPQCDRSSRGAPSGCRRHGQVERRFAPAGDPLREHRGARWAAASRWLPDTEGMTFDCRLLPGEGRVSSAEPHEHGRYSASSPVPFPGWNTLSPAWIGRRALPSPRPAQRDRRAAFRSADPSPRSGGGRAGVGGDSGVRAFVTDGV